MNKRFKMTLAIVAATAAAMSMAGCDIMEDILGMATNECLYGPAISEDFKSQPSTDTESTESIGEFSEQRRTIS